MSNNMGQRTNTTTSKSAGGRYESSGSVIAKKCLHCGEDKLSGQSHPKCSKEIQKKAIKDEENRIAWLIMDKINGYGVMV